MSRQQGADPWGGVPHQAGLLDTGGLLLPVSCCLRTPAHAVAGLGWGWPGWEALGPETPSLSKFPGGAGQMYSHLLRGVNQANEVPEREPLGH